MSAILETATARSFNAAIPHDLTSERVTLGSIMRMDMRTPADQSRMAKVKQLLRPEDFFSFDHQHIYREMLRLDSKDLPIAIGTVANALESRGVLADCGGGWYLVDLWNSAPHSVQVEAYAMIVHERAMVRQFIQIGEEIIRRGTSGLGDNANAVAMEMSSRLAKLSIKGQTHKVHLLEEVMQEVYLSKETKQTRGVMTGIEAIDNIIGGIRFGEKLIIGAKPGMGKSELVKQIGLNLAAQKIKFGIISVEEKREKIGENILSNVSGVVNSRINRNDLRGEDWQAMAQAIADTAGYPFVIVDSVRKLSDVVAQAHILKADHGCQVIAVDHLHIIDGETNEYREREMSKISTELKWVWKDLGVAGIECAQLNRKDGVERPNLASLRDSGTLEQDADVVILLHREDYYRKNGFDHVMEAIIAKNKNGATATVRLVHDGARQRVTTGENEEVP